MEDLEVVRAFVAEGAKRAFGPSLHIEGDVLFYDGWWQASVRVSPRVFAVRDEEPPDDTPVLQGLADALAARRLEDVGTDFPLVGVITYSEIALGPVGWSVWAPDADTAQSDLHERVGRDAFLGDEVSPTPVEPDYGAELGGARRLSGLPPSLVLALGVDADQTAVLADVLTECRFECRPLEAVTPDICGSLLPTLMLVDATTQAGREFIMEMRAAACGRFVPVVAVSGDAGVPLGADIAVDPATAAATWADSIRRLLP
ncbi:MAG TPA: hypothetical protein VHF24_07590 [Acidimicrobiales bacterium]|nr:hypothetical protein [Acidimicrobiales bacterium]